MSRSPLHSQQGERLERSSDQTVADQALIGNGLAGLVPRQRRGRAPLVFKLALFMLGLAALLGLPLGGVLLCLVLAVTVEAADTTRQQRVPLTRTLLRPSIWERIRPSLYWTLATGTALVSFFYAGESLLAGLMRGSFLWLCFRGIEDMVRHPERTSAFDGFLDWLERLEQRIGRVLSSWLGFTSLGIVAALALALSAPGIWQSAGNTGWDRLLVLCGGLYLIALLALLRSTKRTVQTAVEESLQDWDEPSVDELEKVLCPAQVVAARRRGQVGCAEQIEEGLAWKDVGKLATRTGAALEQALIQRLRWSAFLSSVLAFLLAFAFLAVAVFLIVPREVIAQWASLDEAEAGLIALAFGDFEELLSLEFAERVLDLDWPGLDQEPLPKVVFLEAALLASLMLFRTAADRSALKFLAEAEPANIHRWLLLGTAYLILLEREFQYLTCGLATRQVTGAAASSIVKMRNVVLLAPSVPTRAGAYRAITDFIQTHQPPGWKPSTDLVAVFASSAAAQEWAGRFLRSASPAIAPPQEPALQVLPTRDDSPGKFWIWSEEQLVDLTSFEEAQVYGRFVAN